MSFGFYIDKKSILKEQNKEGYYKDFIDKSLDAKTYKWDGLSKRIF